MAPPLQSLRLDIQVISVILSDARQLNAASRLGAPYQLFRGSLRLDYEHASDGMEGLSGELGPVLYVDQGTWRENEGGGMGLRTRSCDVCSPLAVLCLAAWILCVIIWYRLVVITYKLQ